MRFELWSLPGLAMLSLGDREGDEERDREVKELHFGNDVSL